MPYKAYESSGSGGNNGDSYFNGASGPNIGTNSIWFRITTSGNQSRVVDFSNYTASGGGGGYYEDSTGGAGSSGTAYFVWPVSYRGTADNKIEYNAGRGSLPRTGQIKFSDLAQLGTNSDGSVSFSNYYRGSSFIPTAGIYSSQITITNNTEQRNLGAYKVTTDGPSNQGFQNRFAFESSGTSTISVPAGVRYVYAIANGAGGGGGGYDSPQYGVPPAGNGGNGKSIQGLLDLQTYAGVTATICVGQGGNGGVKSGGGGGAANNDSSNALKGGNGGDAGSYGQSGAGGSGGSASWVSVSSTRVVVAGGGGGGGGQARYSDNPYKNGGSYYSGTIVTSGPPTLPGTAGLSFNTLGYYETYVSGTDGAGFGGGGGGAGASTAGGIGGGNQYSAPPVLSPDPE